VLDAGQDAGLWIAGAGRQRERLESLCLSLGISERVHFLGFLEHSQLVSYYVACDVFVLPSLVETQGLVAMEAMHFSRPIIVTRAIVSATELVEEGRNGFIVDPVDPKEMADRLLALAAEPLLRARLGQAGLERSATYAPDAVVRATEDVYRSALLSGTQGGRLLPPS
jgi:1,2-diacylglycerol 3-alpha-glucosyltransferase